MIDDDHIDIERELVATMSERAGALPAPRVDLRAIRRRTATRRRVLVPAIATTLALATAAPFAIGQSGLLKARSTGSRGGQAVVPAGLPPVSSTSPRATQVGPSGSRVAPPGAHGTQPGRHHGGQGSQGPGAGVVPDRCVNLRGPLTGAERDALASDAKAVLARARANLDSAIAKLGDPTGATPIAFSDDVRSQLLPKAGMVVDLVKCAGQEHLAAAQRNAVLDRVRSSVLSMGLVTSVIMNQTSGSLGLGAGDLHAGVGVVHVTSDSLLMTGTLSGGGLLHFEKTFTATMRLPDCAVTRLDLSSLGLPSLSLGALRGQLDQLSAGLQGVVPGVLATDATIV